MKRLFGWLVFLAIIAGVFLKADTILNAAGQPELAKQAAQLRDGLLVRVTGKDGKQVEERVKQGVRQGATKITTVLDSFKESMGFDPDDLARRAVDTFKSAAGTVPEDFAAYYESLKAQGADLKAASDGHIMDVSEYALTFSEHYSEEAAPDLVGYWNEQIASGKLAADQLEKTKQALAKVRAKMQPLLTDELRVLARLEHKLEQTEDEQAKQEIKSDMEEVETEIQRSFRGVPADDKVLDQNTSASDRLKIQLQTTEQPAAGQPTEAAANTEIAALAPSAAESDAADKENAAADPKANEDRLRNGVAGWLGTRYEMGTNTRKVSTDCSGFVGGVMGETFDVKLPRTSRLQYKFGDKVKRGDLVPGDLVFFDMKKRKRIDHVGVYVGKDDKGADQFAHASFSKGVRYDSMEGYYKKFYWGAARVLGLE